MTNDAKHPVIPEMKPYGRYELAVKLFDGEMNEIDSFPVRQDLWASDDAFVVRITRDKDGSKTQYEDRGKVGSHGEISGLTGFGGQLAGQLLKNNGVFLHGTGGESDFLMVATQTAPDHYRCFRRFEVKQPTDVFGTEVKPGLYFVTTEDQLVESSDEPPADVRAPLKAR